MPPKQNPTNKSTITKISDNVQIQSSNQKCSAMCKNNTQCINNVAPGNKKFCKLHS